MNLAIASTALAAIVAHAAAAEPLEACGIVVGSGTAIAEAVPAANIAPQPATAFEIDPATLLRVHRESRDRGYEVLGWYHSHPDGALRPSPCDAARADGDGRAWLIVAAGRVAAWRAVAAGAVHGRFDQLTLVVA